MPKNQKISEYRTTNLQSVSCPDVMFVRHRGECARIGNVFFGVAVG